MTVRLDGLDGSNPLAFLAALGTLRVLDTAARARSEPLPRMAWEDRGRWRPLLHGPGTLDEVVEAVVHDLPTWRDEPCLQLAYRKGGERLPPDHEEAVRDLKPPPRVMVAFLDDVADRAAGSSRRSADHGRGVRQRTRSGQQRQHEADRASLHRGSAGFSGDRRRASGWRHPPTRGTGAVRPVDRDQRVQVPLMGCDDRAPLRAPSDEPVWGEAWRRSWRRLACVRWNGVSSRWSMARPARHDGRRGRLEGLDLHVADLDVAMWCTSGSIPAVVAAVGRGSRARCRVGRTQAVASTRC